MPWPAGCRNLQESTRNEWSRPRSRRTQPLRNCISHSRRLLPSFPNKQAEWFRVSVTFTLLQNLNSLPDLQDEGLAYWGPEVADHCAWKEGRKKIKHTIKIKKIDNNKYISPRYYSFHIRCWAAWGNYIARKGSSLLLLFSCGGAQVPPLHCERCGVAAATFLFYLFIINFFLISRLMRPSQCTSVTQEPLLSKL